MFASAVAAAAALQASPLAQAAAAPTPSAYATLSFKREGAYANLGPAGPYTPDMSVRMHQPGYAVLDCTASDKGAFSACALVEESPKGFGFGPAALLMAKKGWMTVQTPVADQPHTAEVKVRVRVDYPGRG